MTEQANDNKRKKMIGVAVAVLVAAGLTAGGLAVFNGQDEEPVPKPATTSTTTPTPEPTEEVTATPEPTEEPVEVEVPTSEHITQEEAQAAFDEFYALVTELGLPDGAHKVAGMSYMGEGYTVVASSQVTGEPDGVPTNLLWENNRDTLTELFVEGVDHIHWFIGSPYADVTDIDGFMIQVEVPEEAVVTLTQEEAQEAFDDFYAYYSSMPLPEGFTDVEVNIGAAFDAVDIRLLNETGELIILGTYGDLPRSVRIIEFSVGESTADVVAHTGEVFEVSMP